MKFHELKIKPEYLSALHARQKTFEIRKDDRDYRVGDVIRFETLGPDGLWHPDFMQWLVTYVLRDATEYGLMDGYCILAICPCFFKEDGKMTVRSFLEEYWPDPERVEIFDQVPFKDGLGKLMPAAEAVRQYGGRTVDHVEESTGFFPRIILAEETGEGGKTE